MLARINQLALVVAYHLTAPRDYMPLGLALGIVVVCNY